MNHTLNNKKGVSMAELIAYIALYGFVMSSLASLVYVIVISARKVNARAILNRGSSLIYTEILSQTISLDPDTVYDPVISEDGKTISVKFEKQYYYNDKGERKSISENEDYNNKPVVMIYSYEEGTSNILITYITGDKNTTTYSSINLEYRMTLTSVNADNINNVFSVNTQNDSNKYVSFNGDLHYDNKKMEFYFVIPLFTAPE